ncbi:MAG: urease accessory protein UreE [Pseudomonadota bacterium]
MADTQMILITEYADADAAVQHRVHIDFDVRQKARFRINLDNGESVGVQLERGRILRGGDKLRTEDGRVVEVVAAPEHVSSVRATGVLLARICYHLGNRHVPLQVMDDGCRYQHDRVLDDMVQGIGGHVDVHHAPFEPEAGAYAAESSHRHD